MKKLFFFLMCACMSFSVYGQKKPLSLDEAMERASKYNGQLKISQEEIIEAKGQAQQAWANYLPQVELSSDVVRTNDPLNVFGFKLMQGKVQATDFNPELLNAPSPLNNFQTKISIQQPLINVDGLYRKGAVQNRLKSKQLSGFRKQQEVMLNVKKHYFSLGLLEAQVEVVEQALNTAQANQKVAKDNLEAGYLKQADLLEVNVYVLQMESELLRVANQKQTAHDYLLFLLQLPKTTQLELTDQLQDLQVEQGIQTELSESRADVQAFQQGVQAVKKMHQASQAKFLPRLNAFGSLGWNSEKAFNAPQDNFMMGLRLSWSVFSGMKNLGAIKSSKAKWAQMSQQFEDFKQQSQLELDQSSRNVHLQEKQYRLGLEAQKQAEESLKIRSNRFEEGLEKVSDLLKAQTLVSQKQLEALHALYQLRIAQYQFNFLQK